jgi:hypothetical protein
MELQRDVKNLRESVQNAYASQTQTIQGLIKAHNEVAVSLDDARKRLEVTEAIALELQSMVIEEESEGDLLGLEDTSQKTQATEVEDVVQVKDVELLG